MCVNYFGRKRLYEKIVMGTRTTLFIHEPIQILVGEFLV